jgi:hypothetical protein
LPYLKENPEIFKMWCWRKMEKISWTDRVKNYKYYIESRKKEIAYTKERRMANWNGDILRRKCFLKYIIGGTVEGTGRRRRR